MMKGRRRTALIIAGVSLAWICLTVGLYQINEMMMFFCGYDTLKATPWFQEPLNLNALYSLELFWMLAFLSLPIALTTWYLSGARLRWCFNSHGTLDPPKWKVIFGFIVLVLSDLYVGIQTLHEGMSAFALTQTIMLLVIHALIVGFMFLEKGSEEEKKEE